MTLVGSKKLCWNCDGDIDVELTRCPYCGVDVESREEEELAEAEPPFRFENVAAREAEVPSPAYSPSADSSVISDEEWSSALDEEEVQEISEQQRGRLLDEVIPMAMLLSGAVFFVFGFVLWLYAGQPVLRLEWETAYWPAYLLPALPLLYFGWKRLEDLDED